MASKHSFRKRLSGRLVTLILALNGDLVGNIFGIVPDAPDKGGPAPRQPRQAEKIDPRLRRHAAVMLRPLRVIEGVYLSQR